MHYGAHEKVYVYTQQQCKNYYRNEKHGGKQTKKIHSNA